MLSQHLGSGGKKGQTSLSYSVPPVSKRENKQTRKKIHLQPGGGGGGGTGRRERVGVSGVGAALATVEMSGKVPKVARKEGSEGPRGVPQIPAVGPG